MKNVRKYVSGLTVFLLLAGCGGSSPEVQQDASTASEQDQQQQTKEMSDIENLLGIESSQSKEKTQPKKKDDDLLTLLGADDKPKEVDPKKSGGKTADKPEPVKQATEQKTPEKQPAQKPQAADDVSQADLQQKENEIQKLKDQLRQKDLQLENMEAKLASAPKTSTVVAATISDAEYESTYQNGLDLFNNRQYKDALVIFQRLLASNDQHSLSDNAQYWIGESHYMLGHYKDAILDFEKVFAFSKANKKDHAQFKLGKCYERLGDKQRAREEYERFLAQYPKSDLRAKAQEALNKL